MPTTETIWSIESLKEHFDSLRSADQTAVQAALAAQELVWGLL